MKRTIALLPLFLCSLVFAAGPVPWQQADFAADLYRSAVSASGENANAVLSPWGVGSLFGMLQTGARGDTARGMASALRLGAEEPAPEETAAAFRGARAALAAATNADAALELSDSLWLAPGFSPAADFLALAREAFDAEARTTEMGETGRTAINRFVAGKTHGRIPELLSPGSLDDPLLRMVAVDTVYLKAKWQEPFDAAETSDRVFHAPSGDLRTPFLHGTREAEILDVPECSALRLPYGGLSLEMLVLLPSPSNTVADVEALLGGAFLDRLAASPWRGTVSVALPKFEFDSTHDLKPVLSSMGMAAAFSASDADFSGIAPQTYLSEALQKANITVDEEGTEAAAATAAFLRAGSAWPPPDMRSFVADRPFLFLIRETGSGLVLFLGRVAKPAYTPKAAPSYKVAFDANGGKGTMAAQAMTCGTAANLRKNAFTRKGWVFLGWSGSRTGKVVYKNAANVKDLAAAGGRVTLFARWAKSGYTVRFDANGGNGTMAAQKMTWGKAAKLRKNAFTRKDCAFRGWATGKGGKVAYKNSQAVKNLRTDGKTTVLYAKWAKKTCTVSFDANGGKGRMAKQKMTWGKAAKLRKNAFARKGCKFVGWSKTKGGAVAYQDAQAVKNLTASGAVTLYARWKKIDAAASLPNDGAAAPRSAGLPSQPREASSAGTPADGAQQVFRVDDCGVFAVGPCELAISPDPPAVEELGDRTEAVPLGMPLAVAFRVPAGGTAWQLWSAERGILAEEAVPSVATFQLSLPDIGIWHWLRFFDAEGGILSSTWLFPAE